MAIPNEAIADRTHIGKRGAVSDGEIECVDTGAAGGLAMVVGVDSARGVDRAVPVVSITGHGIERGVVGSVDN